MQVAARELGHAFGKRQTLVALDTSALAGESSNHYIYSIFQTSNEKEIEYENLRFFSIIAIVMFILSACQAAATPVSECSSPNPSR